MNWRICIWAKFGVTPDRSTTRQALREVDAEMVAYLIATCNGLKPKSETYVAGYQGAFNNPNFHDVFRATNAVETAVALAAHKLWKDKALSPGVDSPLAPKPPII